jgi:hypothetical protein
LIVEDLLLAFAQCQMPNAKTQKKDQTSMRFFEHTPVLKPPVLQYLPLGHRSTIHLQEKPRGF